MRSLRFVLPMAILLTGYGMATLADSAGTPSETPGVAGLCHSLMLDAECTRFQARLASLPPGLAREHYLKDIEAMLRDREEACDCRRRNAEAVLYPRADSRLISL